MWQSNSLLIAIEWYKLSCLLFLYLSLSLLKGYWTGVPSVWQHPANIRWFTVPRREPRCPYVYTVYPWCWLSDTNANTWRTLIETVLLAVHLFLTRGSTGSVQELGKVPCTMTPLIAVGMACVFIPLNGSKILALRVRRCSMFIPELQANKLTYIIILNINDQ